MGTRAGLSWGIAVQVNGEDLQTGPALSYTPFPPFLIAILPDLSGLPGNKNTRAFLGNPPGIMHFKFAGGTVPYPGERKPLAALGKDKHSPCAQRWPCSCGSSATTTMRGIGSLRDPLRPPLDCDLMQGNEIF